MNYKICGILMMIMSMISAETVHNVSVNFSVGETKALIAALNEVIAARAPRLDAPTADTPSYPVVSSSAADLELIRSALCTLTISLNVTLGALTDSGSCFPTIATAADIDAATLSVIGWLKTIMRELRGVCP